MAEQPIQCPWCWQFQTVLVDCTAGSQQYVEDCRVCCQPMVLTVRCGDDGVHVAAEREGG